MFNNSTSVRTSVTNKITNENTTIIEAPKAEFTGKEFFFWKVVIKGTETHTCYCGNEYCRSNHQRNRDINQTVTVKTACAQDAVTRVREEIITKEYKNSSYKESSYTSYSWREKTVSETTYKIKIESCKKMLDEEWI